MKVVHEDKNFLLVEKSAGELILPIAKSQEKTLRDELVLKFPELQAIDPERAGIVHRLDRETSGLILVARSKDAIRFFQEEFAARKVKKEYIALVHGEIKKDEGEIDLPLGRSKSGKIVPNPKKKKEREALTKYEVLERLPKYTLLVVRPQTGRMHQIRAHLKAIGHPILGDKIYGKADEAPRLFLHAAKLEFYDLDTKWRSFESPLPIELTAWLKKVRI